MALDIETVGLSILHKIDPELSHKIALWYLRYGVAPKTKIPNYPRLNTSIAGIKIPNPIGLAAGFDKNAFVLPAIANMGFGFAEVGAVTPKPQKGNKKPRLFRIKDEQAIINHLGFNNDGMIKINKRLSNYGGECVLGINIGANRTSGNMNADFSKVLLHCADNVDFITINISSPNTASLRKLQEQGHIEQLLSDVMLTSKNISNVKPVFIKIAPDLNISQLEVIVNICLEYKLSGIIATNTSNDSSILRERKNYSKGGISGRPLFFKSTKILAQLYEISEGKIPLIGVGGVASGKDALEKIRAGATAVQLYSALTFNGPSLIGTILKDLDIQLKDYGYQNVKEAVGTKKFV